MISRCALARFILLNAIVAVIAALFFVLDQLAVELIDQGVDRRVHIGVYRVGE